MTRVKPERLRLAPFVEKLVEAGGYLPNLLRNVLSGSGSERSRRNGMGSVVSLLRGTCSGSPLKKKKYGGDSKVSNIL